VDIAHWDFQALKKNSAKVKDELSTTLARGNSALHASLRKELDATDMLAHFAPQFPDYPLRERNLAHAMASYWISMWCAIHGDELPSAETYLAVVAQCESRLQFDANAKDPDRRQMMGEVAMYEAMFAIEAIKRARASGKSEEMKKLSDMTHTNCMKRGLNFRSMELSVNGFSGM
jgi:hypothetical protein